MLQWNEEGVISNRIRFSSGESEGESQKLQNGLELEGKTLDC